MRWISAPVKKLIVNSFVVVVLRVVGQVSRVPILEQFDLTREQNKSDGSLRENHRLRFSQSLDRECAVNVLTPPTAEASTFSAYLVARHYPLSRESVKPPARESLHFLFF